MSIRTGDGAWVIPPQRGVWVPARVTHSITMSGKVRMRTLYCGPGLAFAETRSCRVLGVRPLDRELILEMVRTSKQKRGTAWTAMAGLLLERLSSLPVAPLHLHIPRDPRARRVARAVLGKLRTRTSLKLLARGSGASARTIARIFESECGITFGQWDQQARILEALRLIAEGRSVTTVALEVGYESPSAFITMFRRTLGVSPGRYFADARRRNGTP